MGAGLPKPVTSKLLERFEHPCGLRCGIAQMNGYRDSMEDSHAVVFHEEGGDALFGVFDGHLDARCATWLGEEFPLAYRRLKRPIEDEAIIEMAIELDRRFLERPNCASGSTATFAIVPFPNRKMKPSSSPPSQPVESNGEVQLQDQSADSNEVEIQVGNVGDSRVLLGRNGQLIASTMDHKPMRPDERSRILDCGGTVAIGRVDGNLAVSRAFGDPQFKRGAGGPRKQKIIAVPEMQRAKMAPDDFLVLCCDGVFESRFSSQEVVSFISNRLKTTNDLGLIAGEVCDEAVNRGSRDNITCMIVQYTSSPSMEATATSVAELSPAAVNGTSSQNSIAQHSKEFIPGPYTCPGQLSFRSAYAAFAEKAGVSVPQAVCLRQDLVTSLLCEHAEKVDVGDGNSAAALAAGIQSPRVKLAKFLVECRKDKAILSPQIRDLVAEYDVFAAGELDAIMAKAYDPSNCSGPVSRQSSWVVKNGRGMNNDLGASVGATKNDPKASNGNGNEPMGGGGGGDDEMGETSSGSGAGGECSGSKRKAYLIAQSESVSCPKCQGLVAVDRMEAHQTLWCPAVDVDESGPVVGLTPNSDGPLGS